MTGPATVGVIGVGHLVSHLVPRLVTGDARLILSARSRRRSGTLAARFGLEVHEDNQTIADACDMVILAVRPADAVEVVRSLRFRPGQTLLSLCASVSLADLAPHAAPANVVLAMPVVAGEFGESPTLLYPDDAGARAVLDPCGPVVAAPDEAAYGQAAAIACYYGWVLHLMSEVTDWTVANGMDADGARLLVAQMTRGAATVMRERVAAAPEELVKEITYGGSFTGKGLDHLLKAGAFAPWHEALSMLYPRPA